MDNGMNGVTKSFRDWLGEGESLYNASLAEFNAIEKQIEDLEQRLATKRAEVNQIAHVIGKPPVEGSRRLTAQIIDPEPTQHTHATPVGNMARALSGRSATGRVG